MHMLQSHKEKYDAMSLACNTQFDLTLKRAIIRLQDTELEVDAHVRRGENFHCTFTCILYCIIICHCENGFGDSTVLSSYLS